ncbi:glycosyl hydrolase [Paenibacillus sp. CF384]|uniref:glycosyl hydrolase n=1 Tax=Paenibacillus sp. CF384 TaxID=1884382 RepID=UPI000898E31B|nr:glycosyl hydrolase [Paenibacillus sp. CF384]SDX71063.1 Sucrose-6-phosphate hydrolase SacC, GH32 family [Paenibacillus sp. CF384]
MMLNATGGGNFMELKNKPAEQVLNLGTLKALTIGALVRGGERSEELLCLQGDNGIPVIRIHSEERTEVNQLLLLVDFYTDARDKPLPLSVPWQAIGAGEHDLLLRYNGHIVELFVDGVLVDEDWPMGSVQLENAEVRTYEGTLEAQLWSYSLTEAERENLIRDQQGVESRKTLYLGTEPSSIQYWKPRGFNTGVGDCMPYFDGETFHIYYLFDRRGHASKWGLGAHQWAHISTKDLKDWTHHPMAVAVTQEWEGSICTGSVIKENDVYYAFYAVRAVDGSPAQLTYAISGDGIQFTKSEAYITISDRYLLSSVRDPHVFKDAEGVYHMLITTSLVDGAKHEGCLAHLVSTDLQNWQEEEPFIVPGYHGEPECSDYFEWNGLYYLIFSNDGLARYRYSTEPFGPWLRPAMDTIDSVQLRVPKTAAFPEGRRMVTGFLSGPGRYGGELVIRELVQEEDGSLGLKIPAEFNGLSNQVVTQQEELLSLTNLNGFAEQLIGKVEGEYELAFEAVPEHPTMFYGFSVAADSDFKRGNDIRFEPSNNKLGVHDTICVGFQEDEVSSIYHVKGLDGRVRIEAVVKEGFIDICINGKRTSISRINRENAYLRFFAQFGTVSFHNITIRSVPKR